MTGMLISRHQVIKSFGGSITPESYPNLVGWWDSSDLTTITESAGKVSQLDDKSGEGNHATQGTSTQQPITGQNSINGRNVLHFDGGDILHIAADASLKNSPKLTVIMLYRTTDTSDGTQGIFEIRVNSGQSRSGMFTAGSTQYSRIIANTQNDLTYASGWTENKPQISTQRYDKVNHKFYIDGSEVATSAHTDDLSIGGSDTDSIGGLASNGSYSLVGDFCEGIVYSDALTDDQLTGITNYLTAKWLTPQISSPLKITGCQLWLKGDAGVEDTSNDVDAWRDQSGNSNDATQNGANRPSTNGTTLNGKNVITFDPLGPEYMDIPYASGLNPTAYTCFVVKRSTTLTNFQGVISSAKNTGTDGGFSMYTGNAAQNQGVRVQDGDLNTNAYIHTAKAVTASRWYINCVSADDTLAESFVDGVLEDTDTINTTFDNNHDIRIGAFYINSTAFSLDGDIAEIIFYNKKLSQTERGKVERYLQDKWGIPE